jgi:molybdopterin molybdotransferase
VAVSQRKLISIAGARARIEAAIDGPLGVEELDVADALGRVLAETVTAAGDVPPFANSAMDGFAVHACPAGTRLRIAGESRAGHPADSPLGDGEAIRISTGAVVPDGAEAVIEIERAPEHDGSITTETDVAAGRNIRGAGDDVCAGQTILEPGARLGPAELGVAVVAGRARLACARSPALALVVTGDELVPPGAPLGPGQIHDSNATALHALGRGAGAHVRIVGEGETGDTPEATRDALADALHGADVVVISGGVSVGPHDHVKAALAELGVQEHFWGVALRPGRPTWFGMRDRTLVFGLPGNPVSAMVTFLLFVRPALAALQGAPFAAGRLVARLAETIARNPARDEAVRVRLDVEDGTVLATPTGPQGSHVLSSMLGASGLAIVEAGDGDLPAGSSVPVEPIGWP